LGGLNKCLAKYRLEFYSLFDLRKRFRVEWLTGGTSALVRF
jgi:hypothetical protein